MAMKEAENSSSFQELILSAVKSKRFLYYSLAMSIRIILAAFFIDKFDGQVFIETGNDILLKDEEIYSGNSLHSRFNYLPLAYLAILPGQALYLVLGLNNLPMDDTYLQMIQRIFLKLPVMVADIVFSYLVAHQLLTNDHYKEIYEKETEEIGISRIELFILFNPFLIFTASIKGQFDIFPAIFIMLAWRRFKEEEFVKTGFLLGIAILFKQYAIIITFFLGLSLLKGNFRKIPRFVWGHLLSVGPVLAVAAYINFEGLRYHGLEYHLERTPTGLSLASIVYNPVTFLVTSSYNSILSVFLGNIIILIFKVTLISSLLYLGYKLLTSPNTHQDVLRTMIYGFILFFLLNSVFWTQYMIVLLTLWVEYKREIKERIREAILYWNYALVPLAVVFRVFTMTAVETQILLGPQTLVIIWFFGVAVHFLIMFIIWRKKIPVFEEKWVRFLYVVFLIILPFHLIVVLNAEELARDFVFA